MSAYEKDDRSGPFGFLAPLFGPRAEATIGALVILFVLGVFGTVIYDAVLANNKDKTGVRRIVAQRWNDRTLVFPVEGRDRDGRRALFDVVVLTKRYGWVRGSTNELERGDQRLSPIEIQEEVLAPQLREGLGSARALIAVGMASVEGEVEREEQRGAARANKTAELVRDALGERVPMWTLNLGRYLQPCAECEDEDTSWQRPFMVVAVREAETGTNVAAALRDALSSADNLPSPERYSSFQVAKYTR